LFVEEGVLRGQPVSNRFEVLGEYKTGCRKAEKKCLAKSHACEHNKGGKPVA
jgi:hypothetical protein